MPEGAVVVGASDDRVVSSGDATSRGSSDVARATVTLRGEWDLARREELCELLGPLSGSITIDLRDVTYIDSTAIGVFVATRNRLVSEDGGLLLRVQDDDFVRRTLDVVGLSRWIVE
jgi:anti-anti-sigma factor